MIQFYIQEDCGHSLIRPYVYPSTLGRAYNQFKYGIEIIRCNRVLFLVEVIFSGTQCGMNIVGTWGTSIINVRIEKLNIITLICENAGKLNFQSLSRKDKLV